MDAIKKDLESAVAAAATNEDEARVAILAAEKGPEKEGSAGQIEDAGSVETEELVKSEAMGLDKEKTSHGVNNVDCTEVSNETSTVLPDEVQRTKDEINTDGTASGPVACGELEVSTASVLGEVEVSTITPDTCAEVEVSTSTPEDVFVKSDVKEEQTQNAVESNNVVKVSCTV